MLNVTDTDGFERFLNSAMEGNLNALDLHADWNRSTGRPTSAVRLDESFDFTRA